MSLERIQASVARGLLQADWFTPKEELFRQLGWPALRWRREITSLTMFHKLLHSRPEPLSECLFQYTSDTSARSRRKPFQLLLPYNHSRIVNRFTMLSRTTTNHINLPQQKTLTYHSPLPFLNLQIVCTHIPDCVTSHATIFLQPLDGDPLDQGSSLLGNP